MNRDMAIHLNFSVNNFIFFVFFCIYLDIKLISLFLLANVLIRPFLLVVSRLHISPNISLALCILTLSCVTLQFLPPTRQIIYLHPLLCVQSCDLFWTTDWSNTRIVLIACLRLKGPFTIFLAHFCHEKNIPRLVERFQEEYERQMERSLAFCVQLASAKLAFRTPAADIVLSQQLHSLYLHCKCMTVFTRQRKKLVYRPLAVALSSA